MTNLRSIPERRDDDGCLHYDHPAESEDHAATVTGEREKLIARLEGIKEDAYLTACYLGEEHVGDLVRDSIDALAAPVEVDEAKLAGIIQSAEDGDLCGNGWSRQPGPGQRRAAEAVAESLRGENL